MFGRLSIISHQLLFNENFELIANASDLVIEYRLWVVYLESSCPPSKSKYMVILHGLFGKSTEKNGAD